MTLPKNIHFQPAKYAGKCSRCPTTFEVGERMAVSGRKSPWTVYCQSCASELSTLMHERDNPPEVEERGFTSDDLVGAVMESVTFIDGRPVLELRLVDGSLIGLAAQIITRAVGP